MKQWWQKLKQLFEWLSSKPKIAGLEISNSGVTYLHFDGGLSTFSLRLPPGTVREGKVEDMAKLVEVLSELHKMAEVGKRERSIRVVTILPAMVVYTQSFEIPNVGESKLADAAALNLQMISPMPKETSYMSFQVLQETPDHYELLGAFAERVLVDQFKEALEKADFSPIVFEFPGLSLARLFRSVGGEKARASLLFHVSSDGLNLLTMRNGGLYFNYFRSWQSIQGDAREISRERFEEVVIQEVQKVMNFTLGRFKEGPEQLILVAPGLERELQTFLESQFHIPVVPLEVPGWPVGPQWFVALGGAFRGAMDRSADRELSMAPVGSAELFYQEQLLDFVRLWRLVVGGVLAVLLIFFAGAAYFLSGQARSVQAQLDRFRTTSDQKELLALQAKVVEFNNLVGAIGKVRGAMKPWSTFFKKLMQLADGQRVKLDRVEILGVDQPATLTARVPSYDGVVAFKNALAADASFKDVNLVVSQIATLDDGSVGFTITFGVQFPS